MLYIKDQVKVNKTCISTTLLAFHREVTTPGCTLLELGGVHVAALLTFKAGTFLKPYGRLSRVQ